MRIVNIILGNKAIGNTRRNAVNRKRSQMRKVASIIAGSLLFGFPSIVIADVPQQVAQQQNRSLMDSLYRERLQSAQAAEERARIQAEYDRRMQQGAIPGHDHSDTRVLTAPGTAGSGVLPYTRDPGPAAGESPSGGGSVPRGQGGD